jgi:hypothetical protein
VVLQRAPQSTDVRSDREGSVSQPELAVASQVSASSTEIVLSETLATEGVSREVKRDCVWAAADPCRKRGVGAPRGDLPVAGAAVDDGHRCPGSIAAVRHVRGVGCLVHCDVDGVVADCYSWRRAATARGVLSVAGSTVNDRHGAAVRVDDVDRVGGLAPLPPEGPPPLVLRGHDWRASQPRSS